MPPVLSIITLCTELVITAIIVYVFYTGYTKNHFPTAVAFFALIYETIFNISYMVYRSIGEGAGHAESTISGGKLLLAIFHGTLSLVMFLSLVVFLLLAWRKYKAGINYFREHSRITIIFLCLWALSIISGITFFVVEYLF